MPYKSIDLQQVKTYPISHRNNLVTLEDLIHPHQVIPEFKSDALNQIIHAIIKARQNNRQVIWMMGAHVIKLGLGPIIIDLMKNQVITHIAGNGAVGIHDFELALIGETSENVATSIEDGTFGMAEETGALTHQALREGVKDGLGYGESLGRFIAENKFEFREVSVLYQAWKHQIPSTIHITIGADIIHQHPDCNFGVLGAASGHDFKIFCQSVAKLESGVFLNFGSAVTGPEIFLKAVSIARNLGHNVTGLTTANFDLYPLGEDYHHPLGYDDPVYYYRPRKNIINRPTSLNGKGYHIQGDHKLTIPNLYDGIMNRCNKENITLPIDNLNKSEYQLSDPIERIKARSSEAAKLVQVLLNRHAKLECAIPSLCLAYFTIAESFEQGGTLFIYGNGGSMADAQHISGELMKSFTRRRSLSERVKNRLDQFDSNHLLSENLESGLPSIVLGLNHSLSTAIDNDFSERWLDISQELQTLAKPGDVFLGISTSGKAKNIIHAVQTGKALNVSTILLTGETKGGLAKIADISIHAPGSQTHLIQEAHEKLYHCLCEMLEVDFFRSH